MKDFFYYNRSERNGILVLLMLIVLLYSYPFFSSYSTVTDYSKTKNDLLAFKASLEFQAAEKTFSQNRSKKSYYDKKEERVVQLTPFDFDPNIIGKADLEAMKLPANTIKSILNYRSKGGQFKYKNSLQKIYTLSDEHYQQLLPFIQLPEEATTAKDAPASPAPSLATAFDFDPNTADAETLETLGIPTRTIRSIINYRNKGGQFRSKEDFKKIYTLSDELYEHLAPHIQIIAQPSTAQASFSKKEESYYTININEAAKDDWTQFRGVGNSYANRILKFRNALGGFVNTKQLEDVYGLPDSVINTMQPYLDCNPQKITPININTATVDQLKQHPYLRWFHAKAIVQHREKNGPFQSVETLQILEAFDDNKGTYQRIKPYLSVE